MRGWRTVAMNHRGCGGTRLTSGWSYSGSFTGDVRLALSHIHRRSVVLPSLRQGWRVMDCSIGPVGMWFYQQNCAGSTGPVRSHAVPTFAAFRWCISGVAVENRIR